MRVPLFLKKLKKEVLTLYYSTDFYNWQFVIKANKQYKTANERLQEGYYFGTDSNDNNEKRVICIYDEKIKSGGLVDRLRGILSIYKTCKDLNIKFKILFTHPFSLNTYLQPNKVQWEINTDELTYNLAETDICYIDTRTDRQYEKKKQEKWFNKEFKKRHKEFHIITNALYSYNYNFQELFNELFTPTAHLQSLIDEQKQFLGNDYISTSFRFRDLLGDFNETCTRGKLAVEKRKPLIEKNLKQLDLLHQKHPDKKILVNSDSKTFLSFASKKEYTYTIPGDINHIDNKNTDTPICHDKTFLDFFMIANAESIYLFITDDMYNSGYPYAASLINKRPFHRIIF